MATVLEQDGLPRIGGRVFGLLMISENDLSLDEIAEALQVSKASASINTRMLEQRGVLEKISHRGDRRDFYRVVPDLFRRTMQQRLARWQKIHALVGESMSSLGVPAPVKNRMAEFRKSSDRMQHLIESALAKSETAAR
jgi:DNA-binding transcriptional regulator GbsR (MarR family)